jgi:hypothetical protein
MTNTVMWCHTTEIPVLQRLRQEDHKFKASLNIETPFLKNNKNPTTTKNGSHGEF